jgi:hypothetical protein
MQQIRRADYLAKEANPRAANGRKQFGDDKTAELQRHKAKSAVVTVGDGRGFVVNYAYNRLVVTAATGLCLLPSVASRC